jgi:hypothetical protein
MRFAARSYSTTRALNAFRSCLQAASVAADSARLLGSARASATTSCADFMNASAPAARAISFGRMLGEFEQGLVEPRRVWPGFPSNRAHSPNQPCLGATKPAPLEPPGACATRRSALILFLACKLCHLPVGSHGKEFRAKSRATCAALPDFGRLARPANRPRRAVKLEHHRRQGVCFIQELDTAAHVAVARDRPDGRPCAHPPPCSQAAPDTGHSDRAWRRRD